MCYLPAGSDSGGDDVFHVEVVADDLLWVEAGLVLVGWLVQCVSKYRFHG